MQNLHFRLFEPTDADYATAVALRNKALPDYPDTVEDWRHWDEHRPDYIKWERWMVEAGGTVVALGGFYQYQGMYHPQKFDLSIFVGPELQHQGLAQALYAHLIRRLAPHNPITLRTEAREDFAAANHLLRKHGYQEEMKFWESRLAVPAFEATPFVGAEERVLQAGYEIVTLRELIDRGGDYRRVLHEAIMEMQQDVPRPEAFTPIPFEEWEQAVFSNHSLLPEGYFLALHQGRIAAVSQLWKGAESDVLYVGLTGTRCEHRRRGLALALKLRTIAFAKQWGAKEIRTGNETRNRPMLAINEALGFAKQPVWITYVKHL